MAVATTPTLAVSPPRKREGWRDRRGRWNRRRAWTDLLVRCTLLTANAHHVAALLARRSDDDGKPVWGTQVNMAAALGLSERTVRRCLGELEALGLIRVERRPAWLGPGGRFVHRPCNTYVLTLPRWADLAAAEAPRRVVRAGYCRVKSQRSPTGQQWPHIPPDGVEEPHATPVDRLSSHGTGHFTPESEADTFARGLAAARAALVRPPGARQAPPP
jgi:hypothetical protein